MRSTIRQGALGRWISRWLSRRIPILTHTHPYSEVIQHTHVVTRPSPSLTHTFSRTASFDGWVSESKKHRTEYVWMGVCVCVCWCVCVRVRSLLPRVVYALQYISTRDVAVLFMAAQYVRKYPHALSHTHTCIELIYIQTQVTRRTAFTYNNNNVVNTSEAARSVFYYVFYSTIKKSYLYNIYLYLRYVYKKCDVHFVF